MRPFEQDYAALVKEILVNGERRETRNYRTISLFGASLLIDLSDDGFPLLQGRKIHTRGILGEFAALIRQPTCVADFERWGCNYWKQWADSEGQLVLDYGNAWFDLNGYNQIEELKRCLREDLTNRRMIINSWRPDRLAELSLPCCHYSYQFYVRQGKTLDMVWTQRSADMMIGVPSDMVLAATWLITLANEFGFEPGTIKMDFGDVHIYEDHEAGALDYLRNCAEAKHSGDYVAWHLNSPDGQDFCKFKPDDLDLGNYNPMATIKFNLHE